MKLRTERPPAPLGPRHDPTSARRSPQPEQLRHQVPSGAPKRAQCLAGRESETSLYTLRMLPGVAWDDASDESRLTVSVVIPTRDRLAQIEVALSALRGDDGLAEVVVVDDGSEDGTFLRLVELAREWPQLKPIRAF